MTKQVKVGKVKIGGGAPVSVQSMTNVSVLDIDSTLEQIEDLEKAGCDIARIAVPNLNALESFKKVRLQTDMPLVADVHFDARIAVRAIEAGADKVRINPGNIPLSQLDSIIDCARCHRVPIRIGVNGGSVDGKILEECNGDKLQALKSNLAKYVRYFESKNFDDLVLSVKSSDVTEMVEANRFLADLPYPVHLGVTEAGLSNQGIVKNSIGIGSLLLNGIGDTIRVSLTANPVEEVYAGLEILKALNLRGGVKFVSCPKCGRCSIDLENIAKEVYDYARTIDKNIKIAVMGCEVNGPGECRDADLGLAGANGCCVFFKNGQVYKRVKSIEAVELFKKEIELLTNDN